MSKLALVTGSAGMVGTNLVNRLLSYDFQVIGIDNFSTSQTWKAKEPYDQIAQGKYEFIEADISKGLSVLEGSKLLIGKGIDVIFNLASPASPRYFSEIPFEIIDVNTIGLQHVLDLAREHNSVVIHTSTSEIYGEPQIHPQPESYRGNVNTLGPRSCYDESKRLSETICYEYHRKYDLDIRLTRLFNTYGPYMEPNDGRVMSNFILQAIQDEPITIYGDGLQTRSFQYIDDLIDAFIKLMNLTKFEFQPINLGNPDETTIKELAQSIIELTNSNSELTFKPKPQDDPSKRKPDITKAKEILNWSPKVDLMEGLEHTISYFKTIMS